MAVVLPAHICMYWASVAVMAGKLMPKKFVAIRLASRARLAVTTLGCTTAVRVATNELAMVVAAIDI